MTPQPHLILVTRQDLSLSHALIEPRSVVLHILLSTNIVLMNYAQMDTCILN